MGAISGERAKSMRFFFYGTLIAGNSNPVARALHARLEPLGPGTVAGLLYAIDDAAGWYPALTPGAAVARGQIYRTRANFTPSDLEALDRFENWDPAHPDLSDYRREALPVADADGRVEAAWTYVWNRVLPRDAPLIAGGDFHAWINDTGLHVYPSA